MHSLSNLLGRTCLSLGLLLAVLAPSAQAREWYDPIHAGKSFINPHLTPQRAVGQQIPGHWSGQLVLWDGQLLKQKITNGEARFTLHLASGQDVEVSCPKRPLTLQEDRSGFQVAVKGEIIRGEDGQFKGLSGQSVILLGPPKPWPQVHKTDEVLSWWIHFHSPKYADDDCRKIAHQIVVKAEENKIDPLFFASLLQIESAYRLDAVSCSGALGLGQLMPDTACGLGVDPSDPMQNVAGSAKMLGQLLRNFPECEDPRPLALASYNAGPNLVKSLGTVPAYSQTTNYVYFIGYVHHRLKQISARL